MLGNLFNEILYRPIFNVLVFLYNIIPGHDFGIAIILLTVVIRIILFPILYKSTKSRLALSALQPKIKEIQQKFKTKEEQSRELMKTYKEHNVNPLSGCLPLVVQIVILFQLYKVLIAILKSSGLTVLYPFIHNPGTINPSFLGIVDLAVPNLVIVVLAAITQFISSKVMVKLSPPMPQTENKKGINFQKALNKQMIYLGPILTILIGLRLPAGLSLYWLVSSALAVAQDYYFLNKFHGRNKKIS